jgi:hypothetical protein
LFEFVQGRDVFICDFAMTLKFVKLKFSWCVVIHSQATNVNILKFFVTLWTIVLQPSPKIRLLT